MKKVDLTQGKVSQVLIALALPIMGSSLLQFTYNLVDMLWIGKLGSGSVASIGSSSFFTSLGYAINAAIMIGTGIKVSHYIGRNDTEKVKEYLRSGIQLSFVLGILYAFILILFGKNFIGFLGINDRQVEQDAYKYLACSAPMLFFAFFCNIFSRVFASMGNSKGTLKISAIGIIINIILDPILIYGLGWGILGAALATLMANMVMFILYLIALKQYIFTPLIRRINSRELVEIISLGSPIAFQRILFTMINILLAKLIATFGADAVAAQKIGVQIESVTYMVTGGLNGAVASFTGQNYGARKEHRLHQGYWTAMRIAIFYAALSTAIFWLFPTQLVSLFVNEQETIRIGASYLVIIGFSQIFNGMEMVGNGFFTGIGKPKIPSTVSMVLTALRLPIALICVRYLGVEGIWWSITISTILKGSVLMFIYFIKKQHWVRG